MLLLQATMAIVQTEEAVVAMAEIMEIMATMETITLAPALTGGKIKLNSLLAALVLSRKTLRNL